MASPLRDAADAAPRLPPVEPPLAPPVPAPRGRRTAWWLAAAAILLGLGGWAWLRPSPDEGPALVTAPVATGTVEQSVLATGLLKPTNLVAVGAQVSGRITRLAVALGQGVEAGDLIAEIEMGAAAERAAHRRGLARRGEGRARRAAGADLRQQQVILARQRSVAGSAVTRARSISPQPTSRSPRPASSPSAPASNSAEVAVEDARVELGYTRITAPRAGTVLAVVAQQGQTVNASQTTPTIVVIGDLATMSIEAGISEGDVVRVHPGQEVWFTIVGDPATRYAATLNSIAPAPASITKDTLLTGEESSSTATIYNGLFTVPNPDGRLRTYMTAEVHVVLDRAEAVPVVPSAALGTRNPDGTRTVRVALPAAAPRRATSGSASTTAPPRRWSRASPPASAW